MNAPQLEPEFVKRFAQTDEGRTVARFLDALITHHNRLSDLPEGLVTPEQIALWAKSRLEAVEILKNALQPLLGASARGTIENKPSEYAM